MYAHVCCTRVSKQRQDTARSRFNLTSGLHATLSPITGDRGTVDGIDDNEK